MESRKNMDVIAPRDRRSIRKIPLRAGRRASDKTEIPENSIEPPQTSKSFSASDFRNRKMPLIIGAFALLILSAVFYHILFSAGKISVTPKNQKVLFDKTITAVRDSGKVPFETMSIEETGEREAEASSEQQVEERASGKIIVYNNFSSEPQTLIKNTRFQTDNGLVFRVLETIKVPGRTDAAPGSLEVTVFADAPGEEYNIGLSDFTLPALKNDARYEKIYARSKTPMTGGFIGLKKTVSAEEKTRVRTEIQNELTENLFKEASESLADGFVLYRDAIFIEFEALPDENRNGKVYVKEKAVLYGILFDRKILSEYIASQTISDYAGDDVLVENLDELDYTTTDKTTSKPWLTGEINFTLLGNPLIVWQFDEEKLRMESAGKLKKEVRAILTTYPSILRADISVSPFWKRRFPENPDRVKITRKLEPAQ